MSDPVSLFMLERTDHQSKTFGCMSQRGDWCDEVFNQHHVAYNEVPLDTEDFRDARGFDDNGGMYLKASGQPIVCKRCGKQFDRTRPVDSWFSYSNSRWRNPKTGAEGNNPNDVATPGACWFATHLWKQNEEDHIPDILSVHYRNDWMPTRAPFYIVCPDGRHWCPDMKSTNSEGWKVTGDWNRTDPKITAHPSIDTGTYHAFLTDGVFGSDPNCKPWSPL